MRAECSFFSGGTPNSTDAALYNGTIPFIRSAEIDASETALYLSEKGLMSSSAKLVKVGDLLLAMYGANSGEVAISRMNGAINQAILCIRSTSLQPALIKYCLERDKTKITSRYLQGGQGNLSAEIIKELMFYFPQKCEQDKISRFISTIEERIAAQRRLVELLKKHKQGLLQSLFVNKNGKIKLRFNEFKDSWREYQISDLFEVTRGYVLPTKETKNECDEKYRFPVYSSQTKDEGLMGYYFKFLYENAITWTTDGANAGTVHYRHGPFYCTNVCGVLLNDSGYANKCIGEILNSVAKHYVSYVGNPKLMNNVMSEIRITIPSIREQQKIATLLTWIDSRISQSEKALIKTESIKNGLLQQLFV